MKNLYIALIVLMSLVVILLTGILTFGIIRGGYSFGGSVEKKEANIRKEKEYSLTEIETLSLNFVASNINVILTNDESLRIVQYSNDELESDKLFDDSVNGQTLKIMEDKLNNHVFWWWFDNTTSAYDIYLPKSYQKALSIKTVSAQIVINDDLILTDMQVNSTSGDIELKNVNVTNEFETKTISGEIILENIKASECDIQTTSGDISIKSVEGENRIHSISGKVIVDKMTGLANIETTSGDIKINNYDIQNNSTLKSISGDIEVTFIPSVNCEMEINTLSGHIDIPNKSYRIGKEPYVNLNIRTTSGDINVRVNEDL